MEVGHCLAAALKVLDLGAVGEVALEAENSVVNLEAALKLVSNF